MVRFGILGAGNIALRFAASLARDKRAELVGAACRSAEKAARFLDKVPHAEDARAYGSYAELLADPEVDAIYLALPHAYHKEWAIRALQAGKAVLCEKPAMLTAEEMRVVAGVARECNTLFMEAMKPRFVPLYMQVLEALPSIGSLTRVEATLCNDMLGFVEGTGTYHMTPGPGAGVLLDCGTYCASWIAAFCPGAYDGSLKLVSCDATCKDGIDVYADAELLADAPCEAANACSQAHLECAFDRAKPRTATLIGTQGQIVVDELHRPQQATLSIDGEEPLTLEVPYLVDDFFGEVSHFIGLIEQGAAESPIMSLDDSIACAVILDTVRAGISGAGS